MQSFGKKKHQTETTTGNAQVPEEMRQLVSEHVPESGWLALAAMTELYGHGSLLGGVLGARDSVPRPARRGETAPRHAGLRALASSSDQDPAPGICSRFR